MLPGFTDHTKPLTKIEEEKLLGPLIKGLSKRIGKSNAITSTEIIKGFKENKGWDVSDVTIRKVVNHIRNNNLLPGLVASSSGYHVTNNPNEVKRYIESLNGRENEIRRIKQGMINYLHQLQSKSLGKLYQ